ncbi:methyltransferase domain-containing protein [Beggiatoa leptomitoformis]|uniref:Methyltransferase domain-containing protein n=1 Tax=Beggiatoa leptomitoformis TaxID=288004 RepID=A0A2N9YEM9_9GAMM|nr:methyltransferase domain-containing protein [Beggiatoa leptomitoformis]AUI68809.1 methyltransferase domain-containing protein [Beggiatoa leptomitoformis]QGX03794.1 methyltransferase domain-containing protein [Beggiatoa leptomitoformis]
MNLTEDNFDNAFYLALYPDVAVHPAYQGKANGGWLHWAQFGCHENRQARALSQPIATTPPHLKHRSAGYALLQGKGLEIGALNQPAQLPVGCDVEYADVASRETLVACFPELKEQLQQFVIVNHYCDLDKQGLSLFPAARFDFIILNHVIEHVANPINVVAELFRVVKPRGYVVISAPDKLFTFDKPRALTPFEHLWEEYQQQVTDVTDEHYIDFLQAVHPTVFNDSPERVKTHIANVKNRREHAHVWDSAHFAVFMQTCLNRLAITTTCCFVSDGKHNQFEYFSVWQKQ